MFYHVMCFVQHRLSDVGLTAVCQDQLFTCAGEMLSSLDAVAGRKHPSAAQVRQLKATLPLLTVFTHLVTSQVKTKTLTVEF